jgi:hypothetical protein
MESRSNHGFKCLVLTFVVSLAPLLATRQNLGAAEPRPADDIPALIDRLAQIADPWNLTIPSPAARGFLPLLRESREVGPGGRADAEPADVLRLLVARGTDAVPHLIAHLDDDRPTLVAGRHPPLAPIRTSDEYDYNRRTAAAPPRGVNRAEGQEIEPLVAPTVGDFCFVALGQIVNRDFNAGRLNAPSASITSPSHSPRVRIATKREWAGLTRERHKASLVRDFLEPDTDDRREGACVRLGYYYPDVLEPLALKQLSEPRYDPVATDTFIRKQLYGARDARIRKERFDAHLASCGEAARQGILKSLFDDLEALDADATGRLLGVIDAKYAVRPCLVELYGYPRDVQPRDRPSFLPLTDFALARFIEMLRNTPSPAIDKAVIGVLHSTDDNGLAGECVSYLAGRRADAEIQRYIAEHRKGADENRRRELDRLQERLGWTPLHVAALAGEPGRIRSLVARGADVNARAENGQTPLHVAAAYSRLRAITALLDQKADINRKDNRGQTPLRLALGSSRASAILLSRGAEPSDVFAASFAGRADIVERCLGDDRTLVGARTLDGETALHIASRRGQADVVKVLLRHGADVHARTRGGQTAIDLAQERQNADLVQLLQSH